MTYHEVLQRLTSAHRVVVLRDDGSKLEAIEDGLIQQLRDAIVSGNSKSGASGNKARLPLDATALDLIELIKREANDAWEEVSGGRANNPDAVETIVALWAAAVGDDADTLLRRWERRITDLLVPPRFAEIDAPCVSCGVKEIPQERDGETVSVKALRFVRDRMTGETFEARCIACDESWTPDQFMWFTLAISAGTRTADSGTETR
jgi:hypothetical protein